MICAPQFLHPMVAPATKASVLDFVWDNLSSLDKVVEVLLSSDFNPDRFMTAELLDLAESAHDLHEVECNMFAHPRFMVGTFGDFNVEQVCPDALII